VILAGWCGAAAAFSVCGRAWRPCCRAGWAGSTCPAGQPDRSGMPVISATQGARADFAPGVIGRSPRTRGHLEDGRLHLFGDGEPHRVGQAAARAGQPVQELTRAAARIGADQHPPPYLAGQLGQGQPGGLDVVSSRVRAGVSCPQQDRQRLPGAFGAMISEDRQRVMAIGFYTSVPPALSPSTPSRSSRQYRRSPAHRCQAPHRQPVPRPAPGRRPAPPGWPSAPAAHRRPGAPPAGRPPGPMPLLTA